MESVESEVTLSRRKRNINGTGSIRQRPDGRWEARYTVGYDPKTGKQIRKSLYGKTLKEVRDKMLVILGEISQDTYIEPRMSRWYQMLSGSYWLLISALRCSLIERLSSSVKCWY